MMKKVFIFLCFISIIVFLHARSKQPVSVFMAGDSTMANKSLTKYVVDSITGDSTAYPFFEKGWGQLLPGFFSENVIIRNYARNGRSSKTFIEEGLWDSIIRNVKPNDYVIIQFGHNDQAVEKRERYTPPADYVRNLSRFVDEALAKGAKPIICTSVVRRRFDKDGNFQDSHGEYTDLARQVAKEKNIPMVDMYEKSKKAIVAMGVEQSTQLFLHLQPGDSPIFPTGKTDNTHFREKGALLMDSLFIEGIKELGIEPLTKEIRNK